MTTTSRIILLSSKFNPARLFIDGGDGVFDLWSNMSTVFQDSAGTTAGAVGSPIGLTVDNSGRGRSLTASTTARPTLTAFGANLAAQFDGVANGLVSSAGGGGTAGFFLCAAVNVTGGAGAVRTIWSDIGSNTGYFVRLSTANKLEFLAGNGAAFTTAASAATVSVGTTYVFTAWDDGVNLNAQINLGAVAQVARPVVSGGTAQFSVGKTNNVGVFANVALFAQIYKKNGGISDSDRLKCQKYCAAKAGISL